MIEDILRLRNEVNKDRFRFDLAPDLWTAHYVSEDEMNAGDLLKVVEDGVLKGYAVLTPLVHGETKAYRILEICVDSRQVLGKLVDQIIKRSSEHGIDFVFVRKDEEILDTEYTDEEFVTFEDCVIMANLLDPHELLLCMSEEVDADSGKVLKLVIKDFDPIFVRVEHGKIKVVNQDKSDVVAKLDSKTFVKLFFGETSFFKELVRRRVIVDRVFNLPTVADFFHTIRQEKWYIPNGDWT